VALPAGDDDVELIRLHMALVTHSALMKRIEAEDVGDDVTPESEDQERRLTAGNDQWWATAEEIIDMPALAAAGLRARADAMRIMLEHVVCTHIGSTTADIADGNEGEIEDRLAWSLARDVLAWRAAA
jgi:hypothetical protein